MSTIERAKGRWQEILPLLGIAMRFLRNKHGPCPLCGGKDRFRFDDRDGSGSYYCNQCGPGPGIMLIRKLKGWDHATACAEIDKIIGDDKPLPPSVSRIDGGSRLYLIERIISEARSPEIVSNYLQSRGLSISSDVLRGHSSLFHTETKRN